MRIVTLNVNGIRSAASKGFLDWMKRQKADLVCIQEIKAQESDLPDAILAPRKLHAFFHPAEKKGYSGVAIYARKEPDRVVLGLGIKDIDAQGRYLQLDYGNLSVVSIYVPSGSSSEEAQARKFSFMKRFMPRLKAMKASGREFILCGDWNIAHKEIDLKNWRSNQKNSGLPARGARLAHRGLRQGRLGGRLPHARSRGPSSTPGGPTAGARGTRTWAGASTTTSPRRASRARPSTRASTRTGASRTTRRSPSTTTTPCSAPTLEHHPRARRPRPAQGRLGHGLPRPPRRPRRRQRRRQVEPLRAHPRRAAPGRGRGGAAGALGALARRAGDCTTPTAPRSTS